MDITHHSLVGIHPKAKIAPSAKIAPFVTIEEDVVIGENTVISSFSTICNGARIGNNCNIYPGAVISPASQDLKYKGSKTTTEIGDNTVVREYVTIHRGTEDRLTTKIGKNCLIMAYSHIAHDCTLGNNVILANCCHIAGHVTVDDWAVVEGLNGIVQFLKIGKHAFVGSMGAVRKDVPPFVRVARDPSVFIGVNTIGLRRRGFSTDTIRDLEEIYRIIFLKKLNISNALKLVEKEVKNSTEKQEVINFIKLSDKGIVKSPLQNL